MTSAVSEDLLNTLRSVAPRDGRPYLTPVPDCEPPYDELPPPRRALSTTMAQVAAIKPAPVPAEAEPRARGPIVLSTAPAAAMTAVERPAAPSPTPATGPGSAPAARSIAGAAARILIEALCGARPVRQLAGTCAAPVLTTLGRRARVGGSIPRLMSVHVSEPAPRVAEVAAVYRDRDRVAALAFRLETVGERWRVTELQLA